MTQRAERVHGDNLYAVTWVSSNDKKVDDIDITEGIRGPFEREHDPECLSGAVAGATGFNMGSLDTDAHIVYPWRITQRRVNPYWIMSAHYHDMATLQSQVVQLRDEIRNLRGLQPQIVYVEEIPLSDAKEKVVQYFEEHSEADLEELMINLKIPVRILVDVIDELRKEGRLSPVGDE